MGNFISQVKSILLSMVIKRDKAARLFETDLEYTKAADKYINTIDYGDYWDSYVKFDYDVLVDAGLDKSLIPWYMESKDNIPREMRSKVMTLQKNKIINNYVEHNNYYRMLNGQPPIEDLEEYDKWVEEQKKEHPDPSITNPFVYSPENDYDIPTDIPVHKLSTEDISFMESVGILPELRTKYPNKGYLNYLGTKSISIYTSRTASNFDILYIDYVRIESTILNDFRLFYDKARAYYMIAIYNREFTNTFAWYDEFIGFCIVIMAVQRLISNIYKQGLTRDFYDAELIKFLFKSYSIPYIEDLDLSYQRALAKSLNVLLQNKATDKVLYDVSYLLGFYDINIYKYYLVKRQFLDSYNRPVFVYKVDPITGETVPDYPAMFDFHFQQINLKEKAMNTALTDNRNTVNYYSIIAEDPYWINDDELKQKIYETDFNHVVTKYMSLDVSIKVVELIYEVCHTIRMMIDDQKEYKKIAVLVPKIAPHELSLFDLVIFLCAMGASKFGLEGKVPINARKIASVYGFNFKLDLSALRDSIFNTTDMEFGDYICVTGDEDDYTYYQYTGSGNFKEVNDIYTSTSLPIDDLVIDRLYHVKGDDVIMKWTEDGWFTFAEITEVSTMEYSHVDPSLVKFLLNMSAVDLKTVDQMYQNIKGLRVLITEYLYKVKDKDVYYQYRKLYNSLLTVLDTEDLYQKDGAQYLSFSSLLEVTNPELYTLWDSIKEREESLDYYIDAIFVKFASLSDYKYLANANRADTIFEFVMKLIRFFKSYTVDFVNSGVHFFFADHYLTALKIMDWFNIGMAEILFKDVIAQNRGWYKDWIDTMASILDIKSRINFHDTLRMYGLMRIYDEFHGHFRDYLRMHKESLLKESLTERDLIDKIFAERMFKDYSGLSWQDTFVLNLLEIDLRGESWINFHDALKTIDKLSWIKDISMLTDDINHIISENSIYDKEDTHWHWKDTFLMQLLSMDLDLHDIITWREKFMVTDTAFDYKDKAYYSDYMEKISKEIKLLDDSRKKGFFSKDTLSISYEE